MLDVFLHGRHVGQLVRDEAGVTSFVLTEEYANDSSRLILGQQFEDRRDHRVFRQGAHPGRLPSFFANLLPEGALEAMIRAQRSVPDDATLLAVVGRDLPGAVTVQPSVGASRLPPDVMAAFEEPSVTDVPMPDGTVRFSLAGVQLKFSAVRDAEDRFTLPFHGRGGRWILKFGSRQYPRLPDNEFFTMRWAARAGVCVPRNELVAADTIVGLDERFAELGANVFVVERYDRVGDDGRVHQEDFAQIRGILPEQKYGGASYEGLARFVADTCGRDDLLEFVRRVAFSIVSGNTDMHLKNWSLVYPDGRTARLAPAYDLVFVREYLPEDLLALPLAKERDPMRIGWEHFARLERFLRERGHEAPVRSVAREIVHRATAELRAAGSELPGPYRTRLEAYVAALPLVQRMT